MLECIDKVLDVSPKELYLIEFQVYAALEFTLFLPYWDIAPHIERILSQRNETLEAYLGTAQAFYA